MLSGFIRALAAILSSFAVLWIGLGVGLWWDRRPAGEPSISFHVLFWPVKLSAPDSLAVSAYAKGRADQLSADRAATAKAVKAQAASTQRIATQDRAAQVRIRTVTRTLIQRIPLYVTPEADQRSFIPRGFVWLHDDAAAGRAPGGDRAGSTDGAAAGVGPAAVEADADSGLRLSDVAATVVTNYGVCRATRQQLLDLQQWEREREAIAPH